MRVAWLAAAEHDRAAIVDDIASDNPAAAKSMDEVFSNAATRLATFPLLGHPGRLPGTREILPHRSYRLVYAIHDETVWILALVHTARMWPPVRVR